MSSGARRGFRHHLVMNSGDVALPNKVAQRDMVMRTCVKAMSMKEATSWSTLDSFKYGKWCSELLASAQILQSTW